MEAAGERRNSRQIAAPHGEDVLAARQCAVMCSAAACYGHTAPTFWGVIGLMWMSLGLDALWDRLKNLLPVKPAPVTLRVAVELARRITRYAAAKLKKIHEFARLNIQTIHENILPAIGDVLRAIGIVRAPLIVAVIFLGAAILSLPDQTTELYRVMALDYEARHFQVWETLHTDLFCSCLRLFSIRQGARSLKPFSIANSVGESCHNGDADAVWRFAASRCIARFVSR